MLAHRETEIHMAIGMVFNGDGVPEPQHQQVCERVCPGDRPVPRMLYHAAGPTPNGFCVIEVCESHEVVEDFFEKELGAALKDAHITLQPVFFDVINSMKA